MGYGSMSWRGARYPIRIVKPGTKGSELSWKTVNGYACPPFAARHREDGRWSCDHMPTGALVGTFDRLKDAKQYARELVEATGGVEAWEAFTATADRPEPIRNALQVVGARHDQLLRGAG